MTERPLRSIAQCELTVIASTKRERRARPDKGYRISRRTALALTVIPTAMLSMGAFTIAPQMNHWLAWCIAVLFLVMTVAAQLRTIWGADDAAPRLSR